MRIFKALLKMEFLLTKRQLANLIMAIGMPVAFFLFFSGFMGEGLTKAIEAIYVRNYMITMAGFSSLSFAFFTFPFSMKDDQLSNRMQLLRHSPVPMWQYYLAKIIRILFYYCLAITVVFLTGHILRQVSMPIEQWMQSFLLLVSYFKNTELMSMVANICYMSLAVLGGMWMPITMFPKWLQALSKLTPTYHLTQVILSPFANSFAGFSLIILIGYGIIMLVIAYLLPQKRHSI